MHITKFTDMYTQMHTLSHSKVYTILCMISIRVSVRYYPLVNNTVIHSTAWISHWRKMWFIHLSIGHIGWKIQGCQLFLSLLNANVIKRLTDLYIVWESGMPKAFSLAQVADGQWYKNEENCCGHHWNEHCDGNRKLTFAVSFYNICNNHMV